MAFEGLTDRLQKAMEKLRRKPKVTEADLRETMREIRLALLEADVNFAVVKDFVKTVREKAAGAEVLKGLNPAQQIVKIVNEELTKLMGEEAVPLNKAPHIPTVIMMVGLQGAGKTTTAGKLALRLKNEENARPMFTDQPQLRSCSRLLTRLACRYLKKEPKKIPLISLETGWNRPSRIITTM